MTAFPSLAKKLIKLEYFRRKFSIYCQFTKAKVLPLPFNTWFEKLSIDIKFSKVILPVIWCWNHWFLMSVMFSVHVHHAVFQPFFCNILVWIYWSWAFFKWQRPSAHSQHLWQVQQQVLNLYKIMLNYLNLHLEWHKMLLNMVINIRQNIADWFLIKQIFLL